MSERKSFLLRLDPKVHEAMQRWADDDLRSLNAQIEFVLRRSLQQSGRFVKPEGDAGASSEEPARKGEERGDS